MNKADLTIMGHGWWQEKDKAWFVPIKVNALFEVDMQKRVIKMLSGIPEESLFGHRDYLHVMKFKNVIYCIPMYASVIRRYHLNRMSWDEVEIDNKNRKSVLGFLVGNTGNELYVLTWGFHQLWELDLEKGVVRRKMEIGRADEVLGGNIMIKNSVYILSKTVPRIYRYDLLNEQKKVYELPEIEDQLDCVCFDGNYFWISGTKKKIYLWDGINNKVEILDNFPKKFGIYEFNGDSAEVKRDFDDCGKKIFSSMHFINDMVWMIPECGNTILYCNVKDREIKSFEIENEQESTDTLKSSYRITGIKYLLQYIREKRYLGVYSFKNKGIFEIDTLRMEYVNLEYEINMESMGNAPFQPTYMENSVQIPFYDAKIKCGQEKAFENLNYGEKIWKSIRQD